jgi:hypothetical protein
MFLQPFAFKMVRMSRILSLVTATLLAMAANAFAQEPPGTPAPAQVPNSDKLDKGAKTEAKKNEARKERRAQERKDRRDHRKNIQHRQRRHS